MFFLGLGKIQFPSHPSSSSSRQTSRQQAKRPQPKTVGAHFTDKDAKKDRDSKTAKTRDKAKMEKWLKKDDSKIEMNLHNDGGFVLSFLFLAQGGKKKERKKRKIVSHHHI